jgi:choline-glycine betaine transporter
VGLLVAGIAASLLLTGGVKAVQTATVVFALPFTLVIVLMTVALWRAVREDWREDWREENRRERELRRRLREMAGTKQRAPGISNVHGEAQDGHDQGSSILPRLARPAVGRRPVAPKAEDTLVKQPRQ